MIKAEVSTGGRKRGREGEIGRGSKESERVCVGEGAREREREGEENEG